MPKTALRSFFGPLPQPPSQKLPVMSLGLLLRGSGILFWGSFPASWLLGPFRLYSTFKALEALRAFMALLAGHALRISYLKFPFKA